MKQVNGVAGQLQLSAAGSRRSRTRRARAQAVARESHAVRDALVRFAPQLAGESIRCVMVLLLPASDIVERALHLHQHRARRTSRIAARSLACIANRPGCVSAGVGACLLWVVRRRYSNSRECSTSVVALALGLDVDVIVDRTT